MTESIPEIVIIAAIDENRGIGKERKIPWRIPEDMDHFKRITIGHPVIMGRVTWDSLPIKFKPLSERTNIVVTRLADFETLGVKVAFSIREALSIASEIDSKRISIIGGSQIYSQTLAIADRLDLTEVEGNFDCDSFFPEYLGFGTVTNVEPRENDWFTSNKGLRYRYLTVIRRQYRL